MAKKNIRLISLNYAGIKRSDGTSFNTGCERYNVLFAVGGIAQRLRWDHYIDLGGLDNDLGGIDKNTKHTKNDSKAANIYL